MIHSPLRKALRCCSIATNALCAGGMFVFPLISSIVGKHCKLSQPQLTTIVLAGMMGQYTIAALVGWISDQHGPALCSLVAALLFASGFGGFSWEVSKTPDNITGPVHGAFFRLTFSFFLVGLGTVFGYFSSIFAASRSFPNHIGLASGTSMALFGLSPLLFSVIASTFFSDPDTELNVAHYTRFMAIFNCIAYIGGFVFLQQIPRNVDNGERTESQSDHPTSTRDENSPLLDVFKIEPTDPTVSELLKQPDFWLLGMFSVLSLGLCEMIISNIGTIVVSLPSSSTTTGDPLSQSGISFQVNLIAAANTLTRISVGPLADFLSPVAACLPSGARKHRISRFVFLSGPAVLLALASLWMTGATKTRNQIWVLSLGTGVSYSSVFTILPSLISSMWGVQNMGRNFGLMMYAPFMGTPLFSYAYAFISARNGGSNDGLCFGRSCWFLTFCLSFVTSCVALMISFVLCKRWKGRI